MNVVLLNLMINELNTGCNLCNPTLGCYKSRGDDAILGFQRLLKTQAVVN